ncbi:MAG: 1-acyl-sn-glycerol-3-phosphate acyltransferase [Pseudomonadota bacterium]
MNDEALQVRRNKSAFLESVAAPENHIVDTLIEERCPSFVSHWTWPMVRPILYTMLGYSRARRTADYLQTLRGQDAFDHLAQVLRIDLDLQNIERMPKTGRLVVAANHPTGLADGIAVWDALRQVRRDLVIFANADAIRVNPEFDDVIIPVEWVMDKRTPAKTRETLRLAKEAFAEEKCVVIFPSGRLATKIDGTLTEQSWMPSIVSLARKHKAMVQPLNLKATNSSLYYLLAKLNGELRDITLFHELLNKQNSRFDLTFGPLISPHLLDGDVGQVTDALQHHVAYHLAENPDRLFSPLVPEVTPKA